MGRAYTDHNVGLADEIVVHDALSVIHRAITSDDLILWDRVRIAQWFLEFNLKAEHA